jgi:hypothetical protein
MALMMHEVGQRLRFCSLEDIGLYKAACLPCFSSVADLVSNYLRGMDEASRVSSPISYRGDCRTANTFDALQPVVLGHAMDSPSKMTSPLLEHCMAPQPLFGDAWPLFKPAARFNAEPFQERQVRFYDDTQGPATQDSLESVAPSLIEVSLRSI